MTDHLASLPVAQVAQWYRRLAERIGREKVNGEQALAPILMLHWLDNRDAKSTFTFPPPTHLKESSYITAVLRHHRGVFLSQEPAKNGRIVGVIPRLRGAAGFTRWNVTDLLEMDYHSLVQIGSGRFDLLRIQRSGTRAERDLLTSLRGFQLHSRAWVEGRPNAGNRHRVDVQIHWWAAHVEDRYDWDYSEHFTVPNPDFGSNSSNAVRSGDRQLTVYHSNAKRLEDARLATPYNIRSHHWHVTGSMLDGARETVGRWH